MKSSFLHLLCLTSKLNLPRLRTSAIHDNGEVLNFSSLFPETEVLTIYFVFRRLLFLCVTLIVLGVSIMRETCYTRYKLGHQGVHNCHLSIDTLTFLPINDISNVIICRGSLAICSAFDIYMFSVMYSVHTYVHEVYNGQKLYL